MNSMIEKEYIIKKINEILKRTFGIRSRAFKENYEKEYLLGKTFHLSARELVYLLYEIENEFKITISEEDISSGKFSTIENIVEIIILHYRDKKYQTA